MGTLNLMQPKRPGALLQRACDCGGKSDCESCRKKKLQRRADGGDAATPSLPAFDTGGGHPLPRALRDRLEPGFGADFSGVRLHDDATSHAAARALRAQAFTLGQHVHFGAGKLRPSDERGLHLMAHELAHTLQQRGAPAAVAARGDDDGGVEVDAATSPLEREADAAADAVLGGGAARVRTSSAVGAAAKLQRAPVAEGTVERVVDANTTVFVTRKLVEGRCNGKRIPKTEIIPRKDVFFWDDDAQAIGFKYSICRGEVQLESGVTIDYSRVEQAAKDLMRKVGSNPQSGPDALRDAVNSASIQANGHVTFTVNRTLEVKTTTESSAGAQEQTAKVKLRVLVNTGSDKVQVIAEAGAGISVSEIQREVEKFVRGQLNLGPVVIEVKYTSTQTTPATGPRRDDTEFKAGIGTKDVNVGPVQGGFICGVTKTGDAPASLGCDLTVREKPSKPKTVDCFECQCRPPTPEYACRKVVKPHTKQEVDKPADTQHHKLLYKYDSTAPANEGEFAAGVEGIAALAKGDYTVQAIDGRASPEASVEYNEKLGLERARHARGRLAKALGAGAKPLPEAQGSGELLGGSSKREGEASDDELIDELKAKLQAETDEERRLDLLGVVDASRSDPVRRQQVLADIQAFIDGRDAKGTLRRRARWEKIFPHLRRVEVRLRREKSMKDVQVDKSDDAIGCTKEDTAFADGQLGPIPEGRRVPKEQCNL